MKHTGVLIPRSVRRAIVAHARRERPRECCGLIVGRDGRVQSAVPMRNVARGTTRFRIDPRDHIELRRRLRAEQPALDIIGVYHSHPAGRAYPSRTDVAEAHYPDWIYVIVGLGAPRAEIGAFRIVGDRIERLTRRHDEVRQVRSVRQVR